MFFLKKSFLIGFACVYFPLISNAQNDSIDKDIIKKPENSITISKTKIELSPGQKSEFLTIYNKSETEAFGFSIEAAKWYQVNGQDKLEPSLNILLAPKTFVIEPKQYKNIRLVASDYDMAKKDYSYRLILNQISRESKNQDISNNTKLKLSIKMTVPVFFMSDLFREHDQLDISAVINNHNKELSVKNNSSQYVFLKSAIIDGTSYKYNWYVLPQNTITYKVEDLKNTDTHTIELVTDRMKLNK